MAIRAQTPDENYEVVAAAMIAEGVTETKKGEVLATALRGTKIDQLWPAVPLRLKNRGAFDRATARGSLQTEAAQRLFDELVAEALPRVRWRTKGRGLVFFSANCIAMRAEEMALEAALAK